MQILIRSILGGAALGALSLTSGLATMFAATAFGIAADPWLIVAGAVLCTAIVATISFMSMTRAMQRLQSELEGDGIAIASQGPRWLRSVLRTMTDYQVRHRQAEAAWRTRRRELEINAKMAVGGQRQAEAVLGVMDEAVLVCNIFQEVMFINPAAGVMLGCDPVTAVGRSISEIVSDAIVLRIIQDTLDAGVGVDPRRCELSLDDVSGESACEIVSACVPDDRGRTASVVTVLHDLSREREISQLKSEFVSKASHELRTPLSSMRAYVEMLVDGEAEDDATRNQFYGIIQAETERLSRLVDNMLNISRIEAGIIEVDRSTVDVRELVESAVRTMEPQARERRISLHAEISQLGATVSGDADMLCQVVVNLLSNAVKYTPEGGRVTVSVDSDTLTRSVHVAVSDTGLGIAPADAEHVFEKFYRVENYKRVAKGTGLGLNLCRHIIETVHRGQIGLESTLGMGSRFWFTVPMGQEPALLAA